MIPIPFLPAAGSSVNPPSMEWVAESINNNSSIVPLKDPWRIGAFAPWPNEFTQKPTHVCGIIIDVSQPRAKILLMRFPPAADFTTEALESPQERSFPMAEYGSQDTNADLQNVAVARMRQLTGYLATPYEVAYHPDPSDPLNPNNSNPPSYVKTPGAYFQIDYITEDECSYFIMTAKESDQLSSMPDGELPPGVAPFWMDLGAYGLELHRKCGEIPKDNRWIYSTPFTVLWWAVEHLMKGETLHNDMLGDYTELHAQYRAGYTGRDDRGRRLPSPDLVEDTPSWYPLPFLWYASV